MADMPKTSPNNELLGDGVTPTIVLAGKKWPIPLLAPRQNKYIVPALSRIVKAAGGAGNAMVAIEAMDEKFVADMYLICFWALRRAHPLISNDEFEDMPITLLEVQEAIFPTIARQTGLFKQREDTKEAPAEEAKPGEA